MSNQLLGDNQLLGVTLNRWPTNFFFLFTCGTQVLKQSFQFQSWNFESFGNRFGRAKGATIYKAYFLNSFCTVFKFFENDPFLKLFWKKQRFVPQVLKQVVNLFLHEPYMSLSCAWRNRYFFLFLNLFHCFRPPKRMHKHEFAGRNTQHMETEEGSWM